MQENILTIITVIFIVGSETRGCSDLTSGVYGHQQQLVYMGRWGKNEIHLKT